MSTKLRGGKGIIETSARVREILEDEDCVAITTKGGLTITAELLIGADGVRSCVRKFIDSSQPTAEKIDSDECKST